MTVQILEIAGQKMAVLPVADYERLIDAAEDRSDIAAADAAEQRRLAGEEYLPAEFVDRLIAGENALKTWRSYRGMTQAELASRVGCGKMAVSQLELGKMRGSIETWRGLAKALGVTVDDILPIA